MKYLNAFIESMTATTAVESPPVHPTAGYRWDRMGEMPRKGWNLIEVQDREEPDHECEACGYPSVRYVHTLAHPESGDMLAVGCVCSEHLTGDYVRPREAERMLRNRAARLARLLDLARWKHTKAGNRRIKYRGNRIVLYAGARGWRINVGDRCGKIDHETPCAAIKAAFDFIDPIYSDLAA